MEENSRTNNLPIFLITLGLAVCVVFPFVPIAETLNTVFLAWRGELALAFFATLLLIVSFRLTRTGISTGRIVFCALAAFALWSGLSMPWADSKLFALHHTALWVLYIFVLFVLTNYLSEDGSERGLMIALALVVLIVAVPALIEYATNSLGGNTTNLSLRYSKFTEITNIFSPVLLAAALSVGSRRLKSLFLASVFAAGCLAVASQSRTGVFVFAFDLFLLIPFTLGLKQYRRFALTTIVTVCVIGAAVVATALVLRDKRGEIPVVARLSDPATQESSDTRPMLRAVAVEAWRSAPLIGVGADNFGLVNGKFRAKIQQERPGLPYMGVAEDVIPERAHNEPLQILAELGIIGILIFAIFIGTVFIYSIDLLFRRKDPDLVRLGAFIGVAGFLGGSLVTSYAFRIPANGTAFFVVLALALSPRGEPAKLESGRSDRKLSLVVNMIAVAAIIALVAVTAIRMASADAVSKATAGDPSMLDRALLLDPTNASAESVKGGFALEGGDYPAAAKAFRHAIEMGRSTSIDYSYLATAQVLAGDLTAAKATLQEAVIIYPSSVFLRCRLAAVLTELNENAAASAQYSEAVRIDPKSAEVWLDYIEHGGAAAAKDSFDKKFPQLMELRPQQAVYAIKTERELRHPEEKFTFPSFENSH